MMASIRIKPLNPYKWLFMVEPMLLERHAVAMLKAATPQFGSGSVAQCTADIGTRTGG